MEWDHPDYVCDNKNWRHIILYVLFNAIWVYYHQHFTQCEATCIWVTWRAILSFFCPAPHKICRVYSTFQVVLAVKIWINLLKELQSYGGFKLWGMGFPKFSAPLVERLYVGPQVLEAEEHAQGPLSSCQLWLGSDFTRCQGNQKCWIFCVCLCVCPSCFWMTEHVMMILLWQCSSIEIILIGKEDL